MDFPLFTKKVTIEMEDYSFYLHSFCLRTFRLDLVIQRFILPYAPYYNLGLS